eukprot:1357876-Amorphochlora_amoeboformis.AAC.1
MFHKAKAKADADAKAKAEAEAKAQADKKRKQSGINWEAIKEKLPYERTKEQKEKRQKMFKGFDPNGNGYLSLAEVQKGLRDVLQLDDVFDCKPAIFSAFKAAREKGKAKSSVSGDYVEWHEFRYLLLCLREYFEFHVMFDRADKNDDDRIDLKEFERSVDLLHKWGVKIDDPEKSFKEVDTNNGGKILFSEFAAWALKHSLDLEEDYDSEEKPATSTETKEGVAKSEAEKGEAKKGAIDWKEINAKLPFERTKQQKELRKQLFNKFDPNNTGYAINIQ